MARYVKIASVGPQPPRIEGEMNPQEIVDFMIDHWKVSFEQVQDDKPDLIVVPEACDRPAPEGFPLERRLGYYRERKDQVRDFFSETAKQNNCNIVYSAARQLRDSTWRNSSTILDRKGRAVSTYDKNHVVMELEHDEAGILCGTEAPIAECDFGTVACLICFDLNFDDLRAQYADARPDLLVFSSVYHGSELVQGNWAYSCRSYFVGAVARLPCQIRNPYGEVIGSSTNYRNYVVRSINLDYCLAHYDFNWEKLRALKHTYGKEVDIHDPGYFGSVMITSLGETSALDMAKELEIELLDDYLERELELRNSQAGVV